MTSLWSGLPNRPGGIPLWQTESDADKLFQGISSRGSAAALVSTNTPAHCSFSRFVSKELEKISHHFLPHLQCHFSTSQFWQLTPGVGMGKTEGSYRLWPTFKQPFFSFHFTFSLYRIQTPARPLFSFV